MPEYDDLDPALERELVSLGPLMRRQEQLEAEEPDAQFVSSLRARLVGGPAATVDPELERELSDLGPIMRRQEQVEADEPDPQFISSLRARLVGEAAAEPEGSGATSLPAPLPIARTRKIRPVFLGGMLSAAVAAAVLALVVNNRNATAPGHKNAPVAIVLPRPNATEIARGMPNPGGLGGGGSTIPPWVSSLETPGGSPYGGRLQLSAPSLPAGPSQVNAYRLAGPAFDAPRIVKLARFLGIHGAVKRSVQPTGTWAYAEDFGPPRAPAAQGPPPSVHSVAVNLRTGELIYHDTRIANSVISRSVWQKYPKSVAATRAWLSGLGWPGAIMPLHTPNSHLEAALDGVTFGWVAAPRSNVPEALLTLASGGAVIDARILPPIDRIYAVPARSLAGAWSAVQHGKATIGVDFAVAQQTSTNNGVGRLRSTDVLQVLTTDAKGRSFLVPEYRFRGPVTIKGVSGVQEFVALTAATQ